MLDIRYELNGEQCNPSNHQEGGILQLNFDHDNDSPTPSVSTNKWTFVNNDAKIINDLLDGGLNGRAGIHEGIIFDIILSDGTRSIVFNKYLDCKASDCVISCNEVEVSSFDLGSIDWLNGGKADSVSFQWLQEETNLLPRSLAIPMPYVLNSIPNYRDAIICSVSIFVMSQALYKAISDFDSTVAATGGFFTAAGEVLRFIVQLLYILTLIIAVLKLLNDLIKLIIQRVKYHACMYVLDQINAACIHLGLTFRSSILEAEGLNRTVILPEKIQTPVSKDDEDILGFHLFDREVQNGYYNGTLGDLLRALKKIFKAKLVFEGSVLRLEKLSYKTANASVYTIPDIYQPKYTTNASKLISNYLLEFTVDYDDKNTIQQYDGTVLQVITQAVVENDKRRNLINNFERVTIPFALGKRKTELTGPEKSVRAFAPIADAIIGAGLAIARAFVIIANLFIGFINGVVKALNHIPGVKIEKVKATLPEVPDSPSIATIINDRIGMLQLETDIVTVPKIFILKEGATDRENKVDELTNTFYNARYLWDNHHNVVSHVPLGDRLNGDQWRQKKIENVPFTFDDLFKVMNNVPVFDSEGNEARIISLTWNYWDQLAKIEYEINKKFTNNLILSLQNGNGF